jgi:hypothetical protein
MPAGWGTDHVGYGQCKYHGGRMRSNRVASAKAELAAVTGSQFMGLALDVSPGRAMLMCVQVAAGHVAYATQQVAQVPEDEGFVDTVMGKQLHPWARVQAEAMDRLVRFSKAAVDCGAEEKAVADAQQWGTEIARAITGIFTALELTDEQRSLLPGLLQEHLTGLETTTNALLETGEPNARN